ncbi:MAG TPA: hypothetical protein DIC51_05520 [Coxiellaceae bacterium]|nr:hypothetical protein [Coxiellaceae bacterium]
MLDSLSHFIRDPLNTDNSITSTSIGKFLFELREKYFKGAAPESKKTLYDRIITEFQTALNSCPLIVDKGEIGTLMGKVTEKLKQDTDQLDRVTIEGQGTIVIPLIEVLAMVAKATMDHEVLDQNKTREQAAKDRQDRILTLYNALKYLTSSPGICHQGWRNAITLTLNRVWPGLVIIEHFGSFLEEAANETVAQEVGKLPRAIQFKLFRSRFMPDSTEWESFCGTDTLKMVVVDGLCHKVSDHGINVKTESFARGKIDATVAALAYLPPLTELHPLAYCFPDIQALQAGNDVTKNAAITKAQRDIMACNAFEELAQKRLDEFLKIERIYQDFKKYEFIAFRTAFQSLFAELSQKFQRYYQGFSDGNLPVRTEDFFEKEKADLSCAVKALNENPDIPFIQGFFTDYFLPSDTQNKPDLISRSVDLFPKNGCSPEALQQLRSRVSKPSGKIEFSPYEINKVLMQALFTSPLYWTPELAQILNVIIDLFEKNRIQIHGIETAALETLYPKNLIEELKVLCLAYHNIYQSDSPLPQSPFVFLTDINTFPIIPNLADLESSGDPWIQTLHSSLRARVAESRRSERRDHPPELSSAQQQSLATAITNLEQFKRLAVLTTQQQTAVVALFDGARWGNIVQSITSIEQLQMTNFILLHSQLGEKLHSEEGRNRLQAIAREVSTLDQVFLRFDLFTCVLPDDQEVYLDALIEDKEKLSGLAESMQLDHLPELYSVSPKVKTALLDRMSQRKIQEIIEQGINAPTFNQLCTVMLYAPPVLKDPIVAALSTNGRRIEELANTMTISDFFSSGFTLNAPFFPEALKTVFVAQLQKPSVLQKVASTITLEDYMVRSLIGQPEAIKNPLLTELTRNVVLLQTIIHNTDSSRFDISEIERANLPAELVFQIRLQHSILLCRRDEPCINLIDKIIVDFNSLKIACCSIPSTLSPEEVTKFLHLVFDNLMNKQPLQAFIPTSRELVELLLATPYRREILGVLSQNRVSTRTSSGASAPGDEKPLEVIVKNDRDVIAIGRALQPDQDLTEDNAFKLGIAACPGIRIGHIDADRVVAEESSPVEEPAPTSPVVASLPHEIPQGGADLPLAPLLGQHQINQKKKSLFQKAKEWARKHPILAIGIGIGVIAMAAVATTGLIVGGVALAVLLPVVAPLALGAVTVGIGLVKAGAGAVMSAAPVAADTVCSTAKAAGTVAVSTAQILGQAALTSTSSAMTSTTQLAGNAASQVASVVESHPVVAGLTAAGATVVGVSVTGGIAMAGAVAAAAGKAIHDDVQKKRMGGEQGAPRVGLVV